MQLDVYEAPKRTWSPTSTTDLEQLGGRFYFLPFSQEARCSCGFCTEMGALTESKVPAEIFRSLDRAHSSQYQAVIFPCYFVHHPWRSEILAHCHDLGLRVITQISARGWSPALEQEVVQLAQQGIGFNVLLGNPGAQETRLLAVMQSHSESTYYTLVVTQPGAVPKYVASLPQPVLNALHFYFPLDPIETRRMFVTPKINQTLRKTAQLVRRTGKYLRIRGPKGVDIYEPHIPTDRELEPDLSPLFQTVTAQRDIQVSVIIPAYNSRDYLKNVIRHAFKQNLPAENFEVIVVDDGSNDGTQEELARFVAPYQGTRNFKYLYFSRLTPRQRGDSQFRAGIARNAGVKNSNGRILLFLDSDMLLPPHYLSDLAVKMEKYDVVQGRRLFLNENVSNELTSYQLIDPEIDTYPEDPYWASFQATDDWNKLHNHWKYVCTHSLAVKAEDFKQLGWFRKTFLYYGFEDVDLGFRLAQSGKRFLLNDVAIYHLHPPPSQSEYSRSPARRQMILAKTCRIFFHHSLDDLAFQDFRGMLAPSENLKIEMPAINTKATRFWLSHFYQVFRWRLMWFLFHPAPKATFHLTGGLVRRTFQLIYWRALWPTACWTYWRVKAIGNWLYWRTYSLANLLRWRVIGNFYWKLMVPLYWKVMVPMFWGVVMPLYWNLVMGFYWKILCPIYGKVLVPAYWLFYKLAWPIRKPFYMVAYQYRKRLLRQPMERL